MTSVIPAMRPSNRYGRRTVLLDTNVWRYVVDADLQGDLLRIVRDGANLVQIAPAVLYETLRLEDDRLRAEIVRLMTNSRFTRMMPEAFSESMEILREIERARPDWLRPQPNLQFYDRLRKDWTRRMGGFWVRTARDPGSEAHIIGQGEVDMISGAKEEYGRLRKQMMVAPWKRNPAMDKTLAKPSEPTPGWDGDWVEAWRIESLASFNFSITRAGDPYRDWISPFVELEDGLVGSAAWTEFWLHLARREALPRQWLRWAHSFAQRFRRVSPGSPGDTQLFTYLLETDVLITADRALLEILEECRPYAPCPLPEGKLITAGVSGARELLCFLAPDAFSNGNKRITDHN